jgi:hypothetical protein
MSRLTCLRKLGLALLLAITTVFAANQSALADHKTHDVKPHRVTAAAINEVGFFAALALGAGVYVLVRRRALSHS